MLEIGLGCDEAYGPGASVALWQKHLAGGLELWEGEYNAKCVERSIKHGQLRGVGTVTGDQGDPHVLKRWLNETGGSFDIVIDDGGHRNTHTVTTFEWFWPHVRPGGLYVIEDMHVARMSNYEDTNGTNISTDILGAWVEQLAAGGPLSKYESVRRLPEGMAFVACQTRACAIGKRPSL